MKLSKYNMYLKVSSIVIIAFLLLIPTGMITRLIHEREYVQQNAIKEVSSKWGEAQTISGPFISIPYYKYIKQSDNTADNNKIVKVKDYIHILPAQLKLNGKMQPTLKNRGIYNIVVYNANVEVSGYFDPINLSELDIPLENIRLSDAVLTTGITDLRGVKEQVQLNWNDSSTLFNPGVVSNDVVKSGINAQIAIQNADSNQYKFSFDLSLKGSEFLYFTPVGKNTELAFQSPWQHPKFNGAFLPDTSNTSASGFNANWKILHLNRNYPQMWVGPQYEIGSSAFGIDLYVPVDNYQKSFRASKYAVLFIAFTFITFFFIEVLNKVFIHPVQYILVGIALVVFYTLLLSFSEHMAFNLAFLISALATLLLVAGYVRAILGNAKFTLLISGILLLMYSFIFVIIQLQDFALLFGSIGVFIILAIVMYVSRKIDWYNLNPEANNKPYSVEEK